MAIRPAWAYCRAHEDLGDVMDQQLGILLVICLAGGLIAGAIAHNKNPQTSVFVTFFFFGAVFPLIGIIVAALTKGPAPVPQPPGWYQDPWGQAAWRWYDGYQWTWQTG
jgi:hypothetical protein